MSKIADTARTVIQPIADSLGLHIVELVYVKKNDGMHLIVTIDKQGGVSINDCEALHRAIDLPLDDINPTNDQPYILDVSSTGIDRPLSTEWDYNKHMGKPISVRLYTPIEGKKTFEGVLTSYDGNNITITTMGKQPQIMQFEIKKTALVCPVIKF
ncbi:MAG: ribosome maturation factor RimP [Clostridia bacterium]|nr:ribosome maturation factor RimP [Clostridia bacterium]